MIVRFEWPDMVYECDTEAIEAGRLLLKIGAGNVLEKITFAAKGVGESSGGDDHTADN